ncbi:MAG: hypothetical protein V4722_13845 [Bacteroidota bacterium]
MRLFSTLVLLFLFSCNPPIEYPPGGYDYPKELKGEDTNFYYLPIRQTVSRRDSFRTALSYLFFRALKEPNLSIKPMVNETIRVEYFSAFGEFIIISLSENMLTIKKGDDSGGVYDEVTSRLTVVENNNLSFLHRYFPVDTTGRPDWKKKYMDSMTKEFPELLDPNYYKRLLLKQMVLNTKFTFETTKRNVSTPVFHSLIKELNASGFWSMPYEVEKECGDAPMDGDGFTIEVNTKTKYQVVNYSDCYDTARFTKACQRLFNMAGLGKEINFYRGKDLEE